MFCPARKSRLNPHPPVSSPLSVKLRPAQRSVYSPGFPRLEQSCSAHQATAASHCSMDLCSDSGASFPGSHDSTARLMHRTESGPLDVWVAVEVG